MVDVWVAKDTISEDLSIFTLRRGQWPAISGMLGSSTGSMGVTKTIV